MLRIVCNCWETVKLEEDLVEGEVDFDCVIGSTEGMEWRSGLFEEAIVVIGAVVIAVAILVLTDSLIVNAPPAEFYWEIFGELILLEAGFDAVEAMTTGTIAGIVVVEVEMTFDWWTSVLVNFKFWTYVFP